MGFIADDVLAALEANAPEWTNVVGSMPIGGEAYLTLDYARMLTVLWQVAKTLQSRIDALEAAQ